MLVRSGRPAQTFAPGLGALLKQWLSGKLPRPNTSAGPILPAISGDYWDSDCADSPRPYFLPWPSARRPTITAVLRKRGLRVRNDNPADNIEPPAGGAERVKQYARPGEIESLT